MTTEELNVCHHRALLASARVRLPLRSRVWKGQSGEFSGAGTGASMDFQDHRMYVPGDDPRHINWQAFARTGSYTMKLYREEVRPVVDVVIDVSESMFFDKIKAERVAEIFYLCVESAQRSGASLSVHLIKGDLVRYLPYEVIASHAWWDIAKQLAPSDPSMSPQLVRAALRGNAIRILISDLLYPGEAEPILRALTQRQGSAIVLCPFLRSEMEPEWTGNYEFIDSELATKHQHRIEPNTLKRYKDAYLQHFTLWKSSSQRHQTLIARVPCDLDLQKSLQAEAIRIGALETH